MTATPDVRILDQRTPEERGRSFLPGAGRAWLMPLYDAFSRLAGIQRLHERGAELAGIAAGQTVLDVGCGTGNQTFAVLAAQPEAQVTGLDPDGDSLRRAAHKARRRSVSLTLVQGYADRLPAEDGSVDHVVSALALHHVDEGERATFATEALRALRPGGAVTIVDLGGPTPESGDHGHGHEHGHGHGQGQGHRPGHVLVHLASLLPSRKGPRPTVDHNFDNGIVRLLTDAGFADAREVDHVDHRLGRVSFVQATRP
jgi:ubiquinone/menaquinone biosynthesis C-methylase UbiE